MEGRKGDKQVELSGLIAKSKARLDEIRSTQRAEMDAYEETEQLAVDEKTKRLHYERIRIAEDTVDLQEQRKAVDKMEQEIDDLVYEDTKDQQAEKHRLLGEIDSLSQEIAALQAKLAQKEKAKETLELEMSVYEK